jgi:hypothetical protein
MPCALAQPAACLPDCPMAMSGMSADCPMAGQMATSDCPANCCVHASWQALAPVLASDKVRQTTAVAMDTVPAVSSLAGKTRVTSRPIEGRVESPPRYILNQVFRI